MTATILIIEDDEFLLSLAAKRLEQEGFKVEVAVDGERGLAALAEKKPDLILLDLLLPGMNGFEVLERIRTGERARSVPVIVFSNLGQQEDIQRAQALGVSDYLIKANFTLDEIVSRVKAQLPSQGNHGGS